MSTPKRRIYVKFVLSGLHQYDEAPDEVAFLRYPHHHDFHFKVTIDVVHENREIEFIMVRKRLMERMHNLLHSLPATQRSCEALAHICHDAAQELYGTRGIEVDVSEDGGPGGIYSTL